MTITCWNLPQVGQLFVDEPCGLATTGLVCLVLYELRSDGICRNRAQARGVPRPASNFVDFSPRPAAGVRAVDGVNSFLPSLLLLLLLSRSRDEAALSEAVPTGARILEQ